MPRNPQIHFYKGGILAGRTNAITQMRALIDLGWYFTGRQVAVAYGLKVKPVLRWRWP